MLLIAPLLPLILTGAIASPPPSLPGGRWCAVAVTEGNTPFYFWPYRSAGHASFNATASHKFPNTCSACPEILFNVKVRVNNPLLENGSPLIKRLGH